MNTPQQINTNTEALFTMPIETGLKYPRRAVQAICQNVDVIQIDMASKNEINAKDLGKLLRLHRTLTTRGKQVKLVNVSMRIMLFLELTQADGIFDITWNQSQHSDFAA